MSTIPPLPVPLLVPAPLPPRRVILFKDPRTVARRIMRNAGDGPLPRLALRVQDRAREEVRELLSEDGFREHRLYVLEVAGRHPHIKIGYSSAPWTRLSQHIGEMNRWYHTLIRAYVSEPLSDKHNGKRAEERAHSFMRKFYPVAAPSSRETFMGADFEAGKTCVEIAVSLTKYPT